MRARVEPSPEGRKGSTGAQPLGAVTRKRVHRNLPRTYQKVHVEEEVHIKRAEVEEVCDQPPELPLADERPAEKKLRR